MIRVAVLLLLAFLQTGAGIILILSVRDLDAVVAAAKKVGHAIGKPWAVPISFIITAGSLLVYGLDAARSFRTQSAFAFCRCASVWSALIACVAIISAVVCPPDVVRGRIGNEKSRSGK